MATYETVPKETEPLVAAAPKAASPKFKAAALALCLASAVAGYQAAPAAAKYLSFWATGGDNLPYPQSSRDVQMPRREARRQGMVSRGSFQGRQGVLRSGKYNGCAALYGRNGQYSNGGSPIQMQECEWIDNSGGQRQQIIIPGYGASSGTYTGYLDYVLTQKLCIGPPTGKLNNNAAVAVKSDQCRTKYTVKYL